MQAVLTVAAAASTGGAAAQPDAVLRPIVVSATGLPLTEAAVTQHVQVFTRADIDAALPSSLSDFLARAAGITTDRGGRRGGFGSLFLRGADPSHVVVLIDGVRQNDPLTSRGSAVDLQGLTLDDIERIEVVRGNTSVVHGEAMAGVVQLFTGTSARDGGRAGVELGGGRLRAASGRVQAGQWRFGASRRDDGDVQSTSQGAVDAAWRGGSAQTTLRANARFARARSSAFPDDSGGERFAVIRTLESTLARTMQLSLQLHHELTAASALEAKVSRFEREATQNTPAVAPGGRDPFGLPPLVGDSAYARTDAHLGWVFEAQDWQATIALQAQQEKGRFDNTLFVGFPLAASFVRERHTTALAGEIRRNWGALAVHAGWRGEASGSEGHASHPALGVQYTLPSSSGRVGAAYSSASKLPSFYALGHPLIGNPALRSESTRQFEAYYARDFSGGSLRMTAFHARYRDLIDFVPGPPPGLANRSRVDARGLEADVRREWPAGISTSLQATLLDVPNRDGGEPLRHRPRWQASAAIEGDAAGWRWTASMLHTARRWDSSIPTGGIWLAPVTDVRLGAQRRFGQATVYWALDNVLDSRAEETIGTTAGGRRLRAGLRFDM